MGSAFGAGSGADMLQQILRQKFTEAIQQQAMQQAQVRDQAALKHYGAMEQEATAQTDMQRKRLDSELNPPVKAPGVHVVGPNLVDDTGKELYHAPTSQPAEKPPIPVRRINSRTGAMESLPDAPAGTHFVNEPAPPTPANNTARSDRSYQYHAAALDKLSKPIDDMVPRLQKLHETLAAGTPQADALVAPELLTVMAGGVGSGLRMNEAEIQRIVGGRSKWESLRASAQQWSTNPATANSITPEQRQQIHALLTTVEQRISQQAHVLDDARSKLIESDDPAMHKRIVNDARKSLTGGASPEPTAAAAGGGTIRARDPQGVLHEAPAGTALPQGWKLEK